MFGSEIQLSTTALTCDNAVNDDNILQHNFYNPQPLLVNIIIIPEAFEVP